MNIVIFTTALEKSAVSTQLMEFACYLKQKKQLAHLVCHEAISEEAQLLCKKLEISFHSLECRRWQIFKGQYLFRKLLKQLTPDIVHCHLGRAYIIGILSKGRKNRLLATFHNNKNYLNLFTRLFLTIFIKKFNGISAVSLTALKSYSQKALKSIPRVQVIYNPIFNTALPEKDSAAIFSEENFVTGIACRFVRGKGLEYWVNLLQKMSGAGSKKEMVFWAAGNGPLLEKYKRKVSALGIKNAHFLGYRRDLTQLLQQSQLMLYPTQDEGFGLVLYEALSQGTPVLAQDLPVFQEILGADSPWLVDFHNAAAVQARIGSIVDAPDAAARKAKETWVKLENLLAPSVIFNQYFSFYQSCLL